MTNLGLGYIPNQTTTLTRRGREQLRSFVAAAPTSALTSALLGIPGDITNRDAVQNLVFSVLAEEIERRHPHVANIMEAWVLDDNAGTYAETLIAALPPEALS